MTSAMLSELFISLSENYVISEIIIDLKGKNMPFGFSNYTLTSMFEAFISKEAVNF
jgi:hypothetical protein